MSASSGKKWLGRFSLIVASWLLLASNIVAAEPVLDVVIGGQTRQFGRDELLRRPDVISVTVANDIAYGKSMSYRAVPVSALLAGLNPPADRVIESVALDGFAAQLPLDILTNTDPAKPVAWLAIEPAQMPWPPLPGKAVSAGPFYIVWTGASVAMIRSEQWPYQLAKLESQPSPVARWPALDVDPGLSATDPTRAGLALFVTQCLACHTLNGAGSSSFGPDLNQPMNPTEYLTLNGLRALIRDPKSVRSWPGQQMPGFAADQMSDSEIDLIIGYLKHMAMRRGNSETRSGALPK
ncbi:MAG TPA: c-type cytochrome [Bradyrhizobium sp.]|jgi:mono/diheme cytochrome c family protein|uniref:cytochrome c n=1 Tax=Bradyrhizobium sp. TaxID=376 RepID=UPI002B4947E7|nr:c-type cytochrome [Bradyrhizobium sp.]HKO71162.1 c-type cytochrome [Bradyrhizobium sp.]